MADAPDSKSGDGDIVRVQVPPPAPNDPNLSGRRVRIFDWNRCSRFNKFYGFSEFSLWGRLSLDCLRKRFSRFYR